MNVVFTWTWCANVQNLWCMPFFICSFSSLHTITAQYLKLSCDPKPGGAACNGEPVFKFSSKLKGEILQS